MNLWADSALGILAIIVVLGFFMGVPPMTWGERLGLLLFFGFTVGLYLLALKLTGNL
jgi:hypothetical protein